MAHAQKPVFVFRQNGRVHLNRRGRQFSRLLAWELCTSSCRVCTVRASLCSAVMWRLLVTHSILLFPLNFSSCALPCAITFQLDSNKLGKLLHLVGWFIGILGLNLFSFTSFNVHCLYWCVALCIRWMDRENGGLLALIVWTRSNKCLLATGHSSASWENLGAPCFLWIWNSRLAQVSFTE